MNTRNKRNEMISHAREQERQAMFDGSRNRYNSARQNNQWLQGVEPLQNDGQHPYDQQVYRQGSLHDFSGQMRSNVSSLQKYSDQTTGFHAGEVVSLLAQQLNLIDEDASNLHLSPTEINNMKNALASKVLGQNMDVITDSGLHVTLRELVIKHKLKIFTNQVTNKISTRLKDQITGNLEQITSLGQTSMTVNQMMQEKSLSIRTKTLWGIVSHLQSRVPTTILSSTKQIDFCQQSITNDNANINAALASQGPMQGFEYTRDLNIAIAAVGPRAILNYNNQIALFPGNFGSNIYHKFQKYDAGLNIVAVGQAQQVSSLNSLQDQSRILNPGAHYGNLQYTVPGILNKMGLKVFARTKKLLERNGLAIGNISFSYIAEKQTPEEANIDNFQISNTVVDSQLKTLTDRIVRDLGIGSFRTNSLISYTGSYGAVVDALIVNQRRYQAQLAVLQAAREKYVADYNEHTRLLTLREAQQNGEVQQNREVIQDELAEAPAGYQVGTSATATNAYQTLNNAVTQFQQGRLEFLDQHLEQNEIGAEAGYSAEEIRDIQNQNREYASKYGPYIAIKGLLHTFAEDEDIVPSVYRILIKNVKNASKDMTKPTYANFEASTDHKYKAGTPDILSKLAVWGHGYATQVQVQILKTKYDPEMNVKQQRVFQSFADHREEYFYITLGKSVLRHYKPQDLLFEALYAGIVKGFGNLENITETALVQLMTEMKNLPLQADDFYARFMAWVLKNVDLDQANIQVVNVKAVANAYQQLFRQISKSYIPESVFSQQYYQDMLLKENYNQGKVLLTAATSHKVDMATLLYAAAIINLRKEYYTKEQAGKSRLKNAMNSIVTDDRKLLNQIKDIGI